MPAGAIVTADGINGHGAYAYAPPAAFFVAGAIPAGAGVYIPVGLVADPAHDNRPAIQAAIDLANANGGGVVYIPAGVYGVGADPEGHGAIEVKDNVYIKGAGMGATVLRVLDHAGDTITGIIRSPAGEETSNYGVSDLTLDGNQANNDAVLEQVDGFYSGGTPGDAITNYDVTLLRVEARNCSGYGFDPHERTERLLIDSCVAHHNGKDGFVADYIIDGEYRGNLAYDNGRHGFNITTSTNDFVLAGNIARGNGATGIAVQRGSFDIPVPHNIVIRGNLVDGNGREGILVQMGENILIEGNVVEESGRSGIRVHGASHVTVRGNLIRDSSQSLEDGYADVQIRDYDDTAGATGGVYGAHYNVVEDNRLISGGPSPSSYGIEELAGDVGDNAFGGNIMSGQFRGVFKLSAASSEASHTGVSLAERIEGNGAGNWFHGAGGDDLLKGFGGNDTLIGGLGVDTLAGGAGDDIYLVDDTLDKITEAESEGFDRVIASASYELKAEVEMLTLTGQAIEGRGNAGANLILGNAAANILSGKDGDDRLYGFDGDDLLKGGDGDDRMVGGAGVDSMQGGLGDDVYWADSADDDISEAADEGRDIVFATVDFVLKAEIELLILQGEAAIEGKGNALANVITGNGAANLLTGMDGDDRLFGGGGDDSLKGGGQDDLLDGGAGADAMAGGLGDDLYRVDSTGDDVSEKAGEGQDKVIAAISYVLKSDVESLQLAGSAREGKGNDAANTIIGSAIGNQLIGEGGNDTLYGEGGGDGLKGGAGADTLIGGSGSDTFIYDTAAEARGDLIADFSRAQGDRIDLASIDGGTAPGHQDLVFISDYAFFGIGHELRFEAEAGGVKLMGDIDGDRSADFVIHIRGVSTVTEADIVL